MRALYLLITTECSNNIKNASTSTNFHQECVICRVTSQKLVDSNSTYKLYIPTTVCEHHINSEHTDVNPISTNWTALWKGTVKRETDINVVRVWLPWIICTSTCAVSLLYNCYNIHTVQYDLNIILEKEVWYCINLNLDFIFKTSKQRLTAQIIKSSELKKTSL